MNMMEKRAETNYLIHELLQQRWSPRAFSSKVPSKELLCRLFEAARWAPSASNEQPWFFIVGKKGDDTFSKIFDTLVEFNQLWVKTAPFAAIALGKIKSAKSGKTNDWFAYDVGQSVAHFTFQATHEGLFVHQMGGFDKLKAAQLFNIPDGYEALTAFAFGYIGNYKELHPNLQKLEIVKRERKNINEFVYSNTFGEKSLLI
jgi:nitroreductase